jgi:hypothetical protein
VLSAGAGFDVDTNQVTLSRTRRDERCRFCRRPTWPPIVSIASNAALAPHARRWRIMTDRGHRRHLRLL